MEPTDSEMTGQMGQMSEHPAPVPTTPLRKRRYRESMQERSYDESVNELHDLRMLDLSPRTAGLIDVMVKDCKTMGQMEKNTAAYTIRSAQLLRSEVFLKEILAKDMKYQKLIADHSETIEQKKILAFGDYHRFNYNQLRTTAREVVKEENRGKPKKKQGLNPLIGLSCKGILECLQKEAEAKQAYQAALQHGGPRPPKPLLLLTRVLRKAVIRMPGWSMGQMEFEIEEYAKRNDEAHTSIGEWIDGAKKDANEKSEKWGMVAQIISRDMRILEQGGGPKHLTNRLEEIKISLVLFQNQIFASIDEDMDDETGIDKPIAWTLTDQYRPIKEESTDTSLRIKTVQPSNEEGAALKADFIAAETEEKAAKEAWEQEDATVKTAEKSRKEALKTYLKAQTERRNAGEAWEKKYGTGMGEYQMDS